jgi:polyphosphate kinase 2 (PPK2 family)
MGKKQGKKNKEKKKELKAELVPAMAGAAEPGDEPGAFTESGNGKVHDPNAKMKRKDFERELEHLEVELVKLQDWVKATGAKVCVIFEGRDTAGKGGVIKCITARVSPRVFRVVALGTPTDREKSQMYFQRYMPYLPAAGEVVLFDRSWYNRAGVERVMGFATQKQVDYFLKFTPSVERAIIDSGVIAGTTIRAPATPCSRPLTRRNHPGM